MGEIRKYTCSCGYEKELFTGAGLNGINCNMIARYLPEEAFRIFMERKNSGEVYTFLLENALICCAECRELAAVPYFHYELENGKKLEYLTACPSCGRAKVYQEGPERVICPKCGGKMKYQVVGNWD